MPGIDPALLAKAIRKSTGGDDDSDYKPAAPANPVDLNSIAPPKPDPQAAALSQIQQAAAKNAVNLPQSSNGINPETGMPFFSPQAAPSAADQQRQDMMAAKLQFLRQRAQGQ